MHLPHLLGQLLLLLGAPVVSTSICKLLLMLLLSGTLPAMRLLL